MDETYARIRGRWHDIYRAIDEHGQIVDAYVSPDARHGGRGQVLRAGHACQRTTPRRVITDKAGAYPPALAAVVPGVLHELVVTARMASNGITALERRLRPCAG